MAVLIALAVGACKPNNPPSPPPLTVCAAASLEDVLSTLAASYEHETGTRLRITTGASGTLRKQIELGAPCDVYLSADPSHVDALRRKNLLAANSQRTLVANKLVLAQPRQAAKKWTTPNQLADGRSLVAIASPDAAPAGRYAKQALEQAGVWSKLQPKLVFSDNVRMAAKQLSSRAVAAAIVYATDVIADESISASFTFPNDSHDAIDYVGCVPSSSQQIEAGRAFLRFLTTGAARQTWHRYGFTDSTTESHTKPLPTP